MDKAIKILTDNLHKAEQYLAIAPMDSDMLRGWAEIIKEHSEALDELTAHKAKIDELKEWCSDELDKYSEYQTDIECGLFQAYNNVLQKLEEPTNA